MAAKWTSDQLKAIELRNRNILVAAAAGSGKTAVLVERIIRMISEGENPIDIDRLLVVTFTNAAAAQMKERIGEALEKRLEAEPENVHLLRQLTLLNHAKITTIHSFCLYVVRNYFDRLDIDPDFRIADEGETKLLKADVIKALLEESYEKAEPSFIKLVESYASGKNDTIIEEYILELSRFAEGFPFPEEQLALWSEELSRTDNKAIEENGWMKVLIEDVKAMTDELYEACMEALSICEDASGPDFFLPMIQSDLEIVERLKAADSYEKINRILANMDFVRKPVKRKFTCDPDLKEHVSNLRDRCKDRLKELQKLYCTADTDMLPALLKQQEDALKELIYLAGEYGRRYSEAKKEKNIVDFGDLEHFALEILTEKTKEGFKPSEAADDLSTIFEEILIDEYQDSNRVQEIILNSVSRERFKTPNVFMVGDVKQSIYKFRLARPQLFIEKYDTYTEEDSLYQKIDLHMNFRSRSNVLSSANYIFNQIMTKKLGAITYDNAAKLYTGASYPESSDNLSTELLIVNVNSDELNELGLEDEYDNKELEAMAIAKRIKELVDSENGQKVFDKDTGELRNIRYSDIVILLRSFSGWSEAFVNTLLDYGIPAFAESQTGYFDTLEVRTVMDFLSVIDNPAQDIPLAAVLKSQIADITNAELASLVIEFNKRPVDRVITESGAAEYEAGGLYGACLYYLEHGNDEALKDKLVRFFELRDDFAKKTLYMKLDELLRNILDKTGYGMIVTAMSGGNVRRANLEMLIQKAVDFEATSYHGLFNFIRYIDNLKKYSVDFGEASVIGENDNIVRLTTIHKSKGLEYPVVFIAGMGKKFNLQDGNARILFEPDLGIAADSIDLTARVRYETLAKKVFKRQLLLSALGEELRILYVAMTRAKEKLIMTGTEKNIEGLLGKWKDVCWLSEEKLPYNYLSKARSYMDWAVMGLMRHASMNKLLEEYDISDWCSHEELSDSDADFIIREISPKELIGGVVEEVFDTSFIKDQLTNWDADRIYDKELAEELSSRLSHIYHRADELSMHTKMSVSELKIKSMDADEAHIAGWVNEDNVIKTEVSEGKLRQLPKFMEDDTNVSGAFRGTAMHRFMELMDFARALNVSDKKAFVREEKERLLAGGRLEKELYDYIDEWRIVKFLRSRLAERMMEAAAKGKLYKEKQFVMGIPADDIGGEYHGDELILIQGIIDVYFEDENGLVVVDYKTDAVNNAEELVVRYKTQLDYYKKSLEQITGKKVSEKLIYSFKLDEEIEL